MPTFLKACVILRTTQLSLVTKQVRTLSKIRCCQDIIRASIGKFLLNTNYAVDKARFNDMQLTVQFENI
jgi:hypothetical protein